ncbi:alpha/beta hydrolase [Arenibacter sp. GZD96]|uniref:alpha/beta fold hydrolase n=1 Tax=Aurantibrevibacter litoralis TaxID=3106030 RepID=UPI002AFF134A|nr:alpha/beta hydrolase [Arenibacter sp. GZD-96]MEA1785390.1 alpha/beta hydrolase [Arenibacter sp. GZD-96]
MRSSKKETAEFFENKKVSFVDTTLQWEGRRIHYIETGTPTAPTLVFIHGSPGSWDAYKTYLTDAELLGNFRMIAPDRPGFGFSNFRKSLNLEAQARLLNKLISELTNGQAITLIGHSYGGPLIVAMALERPDLYRNLVVLAGALDPTAEKPERWRYPFYYFPLKYIVPGSLKPANDELIYLKTDLKQLEPKLEFLSQNVLLMHGTRDRLVPYSNVAFMQRKFTGAATLKTINLPDEDHFFLWEREADVKRALRNWLSTVP